MNVLGLLFLPLLLAQDNCTPENGDPYGTGSHVSCCQGTTEKLDDWQNNGVQYFLCIFDDRTGIRGCMISFACNYNSNANIEDNDSCKYLDICGKCGGDNTECSCGASRKAGIAIPAYLIAQENLNLGAFEYLNWWYGWSDTPFEGQTKDLSIEFVSMIRDDEDLTAASWQEILEYSPRVLLGFNEPCHVGQAELTPQQTADLWPDIQALAVNLNVEVLVGPAVNWNNGMFGPPNPAEWLQQFFDVCVGCRVDAIAVHAYVCNSEDLMNFLEMFTSKFADKKIWVTEIACGDDANRIDVSGQEAFMKEAIPILENHPQVERYSWFSVEVPSWVRQGSNIEADLLTNDGQSLNNLGQAYKSLTSSSCKPDEGASDESIASKLSCEIEIVVSLIVAFLWT